MDAAVWNSSKRVFLEVAPLPPEERSAALRRLCAGDELLRAHVENLLAADAGAAELFAAPEEAIGLPAATEMHAGPALPFHVRDLRFEAVLGSGRSGVVYRARQVSMHRDVAVKVFAPSLRTGGLSTRLRREIMATGRLHHPGIAQVLSAESLAWPDGTTRSALVIEYVRGFRLSDYAEANRLAVREVIEIVLQVCDAVAAAHRAGVVHHDVKPANILIEEDEGGRRVKLVDFGISTIVGDITLHGAVSEVYGSLRYAAPERLNGSAAWTALDARSDVYSIGVVLSEMVATATDRSEHSRTPYGSDLQLIIAKAMAVTPDERYGTIDAMENDLRAFLARRPIEARSSTAGYVSVRFIQRNPLVAMLLALAVAGCGGLLWMQSEETALTEQAREEAKLAASVLLNEVAEGMRDDIGSSEKHRKMLMRLMPTLEQFAARYPREPRTQADLANLLGLLGDVLQQRGELAQAREFLWRAYVVRRLLAELLPDDPRTQSNVSIAMVRLGDCGVVPDAAHPMGWYRAALEFDEALVRRWPEDSRLNSNLAFSYDRIASSEVEAGHLAEAIAYSDKQMEVARLLERREPSSERSLRTLSAAVARKASLAHFRRDYEEAERLWRENMSHLKRLDAIAPNQRGIYKQMVDTALVWAGCMTREERPSWGDARELISEAAARALHLASVDPKDSYAWDLYVRTLLIDKQVVVASRQFQIDDDFERSLERAIDSFATACDNCFEAQRQRIRATLLEANILQMTGSTAAASLRIRQLIVIAREMYDAEHQREDAALIADLYANLTDPSEEELSQGVEFATRAVAEKGYEQSIAARYRVFESLCRANRTLDALAVVQSIRDDIPKDEKRLHEWVHELEGRCVKPTGF